MNYIQQLSTLPWHELSLLFLSYRFIRYFVIYPFIFFLFFIFGKQLAKYRIQKTYPSKKKMMLEIGLSLSTFLCFGVVTLIGLWFYKMGWYHIYFNWRELGMPYFFMSILFILVFHEVYHYAYHRFMHTNPWFYRNIHRIHHKFNNPTIFTSYAFHPIEALLHPLAFIIAPLILPVCFIAPIIALLISEFFNVAGHAGYEWIPEKWARSPLFKFINKSTYHNFHHSHGGRHNYGLYTTILDELFDTHHPQSTLEFERILMQRKTE